MPDVRKTRPWITALLVLSIVTHAAVTGCASTTVDKPQRGETRGAVASAYIAVLSVHTWRSMVEKLQKVTLIEDEARQKVIRDGRGMPRIMGVFVNPPAVQAPPVRPGALPLFNAGKNLEQFVSRLRNAVIPRGHQAYVVGLQLTLLPARRPISTRKV